MEERSYKVGAIMVIIAIIAIMVIMVMVFQDERMRLLNIQHNRIICEVSILYNV